MKKSVLLGLFLILSFNSLAQTYVPYYRNTLYGLTSSGAMTYGLYGYDNPAVLATLERTDVYFAWDMVKGQKKINDYGIFIGMPNFGFSYLNRDLNGRNTNDYKISSAMGNKTFAIGTAFNWGNNDYASVWNIGLLYRPARFLSFGISGFFPERLRPEGVFEMALRPFSNEKVSLFGDYVYKKDYFENESKWSAGLAVEPLQGLRLTGRYFDNSHLSIGVNLSLGNLGLTAQGFSNQNDDVPSGYDNLTAYGIRIGGYDRNIMENILKDKVYLELDMKGGLTYQRFQFFDNSNEFYDLLKMIKNAKEDKLISGIAINTSGMAINREMLWEIREALKDLQRSGKKVFVYIDRTSIDGYHFASVADKVVLDPLGGITLEGFAMTRTYYANMMEKLGVGYEEFRYFKYKSAAESFSRTNFSEGDREQRQALVDDFYDLAKKEICESRNLSPEKFDDLVDNKLMFFGQDAVNEGLADTLGRWEDLKELVKKVEREEKIFTPTEMLEARKKPSDDYWGEKPKIALIYAIGACDMDAGIKARTLSKDIERAVKDNSIKAIVFRADSPGGDALASDLVAEALKEAKGKKPVIISQGLVAGSGGYWISMYGDTIVAAPNTITGSIGVIGAFFYNKDLNKDLGFTIDHVKKGKHADLGSAYAVPFFNIPILPYRNVSEQEKGFIEKMIKDSYKEFTAKVAEGRNLRQSYVDSIGQGRVYSGMDGKENGLVDYLGGMMDAINIAAKAANLKEYEIIEIPDPPLFDFNSLISGFIGVESTKLNTVDELMIKELQFRLQNNGKVMPIMPIE